MMVISGTSDWITVDDGIALSVNGSIVYVDSSGSAGLDAGARERVRDLVEGWEDGDFWDE